MLHSFSKVSEVAMRAEGGRLEQYLGLSDFYISCRFYFFLNSLYSSCLLPLFRLHPPIGSEWIISVG